MKIFSSSDPQFILHRIKRNTSNWKPFAANRVREIPCSNTRKFCKVTENSADIFSRGYSASELQNNDSIWLHGLAWLKEESVFPPETPTNLGDDGVARVT